MAAESQFPETGTDKEIATPMAGREKSEIARTMGIVLPKHVVRPASAPPRISKALGSCMDRAVVGSGKSQPALKCETISMLTGHVRMVFGRNRYDKPNHHRRAAGGHGLR